MRTSRSLLRNNWSATNLTGRSFNIMMMSNTNQCGSSEHSVIQKEQNNELFNQLKSQILKFAILPIVSDNLNIIKNNIYRIYILKGKCKELKEKFENEGFYDLMHITEYYANVLMIASICIEKDEYVTTFDERFGTHGGIAGANIHVRRIILRPEYEVYKIIFNVKKGFNDTIINYIKKLIYDRNIVDVDDIRYELIRMGYYIEEDNTESDTKSERSNEDDME